MPWACSSADTCARALPSMIVNSVTRAAGGGVVSTSNAAP